MMMHLKTLPPLLWLLIISPANGEDIDLFKGGGSQDPTPPNVLIFLDNTSNWSANSQAWSKTQVQAKCAGDAACLSYITQIFGSNSSLTQGEVEIGALKLVLNNLACSVTDTSTRLSVNVGLMLIKPENGTYTSTGGTTANGVGGLIKRAVLPLNTTNCTNLISDLTDIASKITSNTYKAPSSANYGGPMMDVFKYYGGHTNPAKALTGTAGSPINHAQFGDLRYGTVNALDDTAAFDAADKMNYKTPITTATQNSCIGKNYLLLVGNTWPNSDDATLLSGLSYSYNTADFFSATGSQPRLADVWTKFLHTTDVSPLSGQQTLTTSVFNVYNASADVNQTNLLKSIALYGGGNYYEVGGSLGNLVESLKNFFVSLNAANQSFAPVTLPSGPITGGLNLNQVYVGAFRPDKNPRWFGNLKLYKLALYGSNSDGTPNVYLTDSSSSTPPAQITSGTGFVVDNAISFWTHSSTFWNYRCGTGTTSGDPTLCGTPISISDSPDGTVVEKGGASQKLRDTFTADASNSARKVYTDDGSSLVNFDTSLSPTKFSATMTTVDRDALVNWVRGVDNIKENISVTNGVRPSIIGDILHSQPVAVNYGLSSDGCSTATGNVVTFYAGNDGMLHAVKGGETEGTELWSYIPGDFLGNLSRLWTNSPAVTFPAPVPPTAYNKSYMIDGSLSVYSPDADGDCRPDKVWLYLSMRRGGRFIYALDVSNITSPKLLWKKSNASTGYAELGETWSKAKPILLSDNTPYLIFGAGYDHSAEDRPLDTVTGTYGSPVAAARTMGRGVFIVNAQTGTVSQFLNAGSYSIPSEVAVVSDLNTGYAKTAYVGDTGGNLWRYTFGTSGSSNLTQIASLGSDQEFLYPPDVASCGGNTVLLIGAGDREKPFDKAVQNRFYQIKDPASGVVSLSDLSNITTIGTLPDSAKKGWYITLDPGEKTVGSAATLGGTTYFPTNVAASNSGTECSTSFGTAKLYGISCSTGGPSVYSPVDGNPTTRSKIIPGGGFLPSPTPATVKLTDSKTGETKTVETALSGTNVAGSRTLPTKRRFTYWYREGLD